MITKAGALKLIAMAFLTQVFLNIKAQDLNKNWIVSRSYDLDGNIIGESKAYFDNTGLSTQTQVKNLSSEAVIVSERLYDRHTGKLLTTTLPAPIVGSQFSYKDRFGPYFAFPSGTTLALDSSNPGTLGWYYSANNSIEPYIGVTSYPYSTIQYYLGSTPGIKSVSVPGEAFLYQNGHDQRSFIVPVINELNFYLKVRNKFFNAGAVGYLPSDIKSSACQKIDVDANGKMSIAIEDSDGRLLLSGKEGNDLSVETNIKVKDRVYFVLLNGFSYSISNENDFGYLYDLYYGEYADARPLLPSIYTFETEDDGTFQYTNHYGTISFNFYNQLGQLIAAIAPEGVKKLIDNINAYNTLSEIPFVTTYEYDTQGRLTATTSPDAGRTEYIYRTDGSIRFSQNAEQRKTGRFSYTNYDRLLRPIESGEYIPGSVSFTSAKTSTAIQESTTADGGLTGGTKQQWVRTYYDYADNSHGLSGYIQDEFFLKGGVSRTENEQGKTWYNYDSDGRLTWMIKQINSLGAKTIDYSYNAQGGVSRVDYQKNNPSERFIHEYEYDADGRLLAAYTRTDLSGTRKEQARYSYYLHGPLKRVELAQDLQGIDYTYTPQGWLKTINHPDQNRDPGHDGTANGFAPDAFGMTLEYFSSDYSRSGTGIGSLSTGTSKVYYNGMASAQSWKSIKPASVVSAYGSSVNNPAMFTYEYDDKYQFNNNKYGAPNFGSNTFTEAVNQNREYGLSYDKHGNIQSLNRTNSAGAVVNALTYHYQPGTNRLTSVDNYATYQYDDLGQMTAQVKGGQGMYLTYDVSGKVTAIYSDAAKTQLKVSFGYDESGNRIRKTDHVSNIITYYVPDASGNVLAIYDNNGTAMQQKEVPVYGAGRIGMYKKQSGTYQYELTDHLGNVRVVINQNKTSAGLADVVYYSDYYPYGSALTLANNDYRYGYQGQFAETDKESAWLNFALRMYDPVTGRWMTTDPYGQYHSPYVGMGNDPVNGVDPDGGWDTWWQAFKDWVGSGFQGSIHRSKEGDTKGQYYRSWNETSTGLEGEATVYNRFTFGDGRTSFKGFNFNQGVIRSWNPGFFDEWAQQPNWFVKFAYDQVDAPYVWLTNYSGNGSRHLNGEFANRKELTDAGISTLSNAMGAMVAGSASMLKIPASTLNAGQYNTLMKGTGLTAASNKGAEIRAMNYIIKQMHGIGKAESALGKVITTIDYVEQNIQNP